MLRRLGGRLKVPRKSHAKKDQAKADAFKAGLTELIGPERERVRIRVMDEHRHGLLPVLRRCWGLRGVRAPYATK